MIVIVRPIMKNYRNFFRHTSSSIFPCIMAMISNITIFFIFQISIFKFFLQIYQIFAFPCDFCHSFVNNFIFFFLKIIIFSVCSFKNGQNFFIQSLPLYTSCLFFIFLNNDIVDIEKPDGVFSLTFCCIHQSFLLYHCRKNKVSL